jgi:subtilase family serine protease
MSRIAILALLGFVATLGTAPAPTCAGANPAIVSVGVQNVVPTGGLNTYRITGTVTNLGDESQANNVLQFVDMYMVKERLDAKGIPPLAPGQSYTFAFDYQRSRDAGTGSTNLRFQIDMRQPSPAGSEDCNPSNGTYTLTL